MIVVMVIGVLAAVVLPTVRGNAIRAKVSEAVLAFGNCRNMVAETFMSADSLPNAGEWGCESELGVPVSQYVDSITVIGGVIRVATSGQLDPRIASATITLAPVDSAGNVLTDPGPVSRWRCGALLDGTDLSAVYLPSSCRGN